METAEKLIRSALKMSTQPILRAFCVKFLIGRLSTHLISRPQLNLRAESSDKRVRGNCELTET